MSLKIDRSLILRNTIINVAGSLAPMALSILTLPRVLSALGTERYGVFSLALVVVGYFSILDLGLGGATTKYAAEALGKGEEEKLPSIFWTAVLSHASLGILGGLVLAVLAPWFADAWLKIPPALHDEVRLSLRLLGLAVPLILVGPSLNGLLEAAQRFDLANAIAIPQSASMSLAAYFGATIGFHLPGIIILIVLVRVVFTSSLLLLCLRLFPILRRAFDVSMGSVRHLIGYGAWITVGGLVGPILLNTDRFMLGRYVSLTDVAYYTVPFSIILRLGIVPGGLVRVLFPAFSSLGAADQADLEDLYVRSLKYLLLANAPVALGMAALGPDLFRLWLGPDVALHSSPIFLILLYGVVFSTIGSISGAFLQGVGRPDLVTKFYIAFVPVNTVLVWYLVQHLGAAGAAWSSTVRTGIETIFFAVMCFRVGRIALPSLIKHRILGMGATLLVLCALMRLAPMPETIGERLAGFIVSTVAFLALGWTIMLDAEDRSFIKSQISVKLKTAS